MGRDFFTTSEKHPPMTTFRFSIRDVLWLTVVAALVLGWAMDHDRLMRFNRALQSIMRDHGLKTPDVVIIN